MQYYFNELDPVRFQRLINGILIARFGEDALITPLRGPDGGKDGGTLPSRPYFEFQVSEVEPPVPSIYAPPQKGRYLFQVKHHSTVDMSLSDARRKVLSDFRKELKENVLTRKEDQRINYFFLVTNVPASSNAMSRVERISRELIEGETSLYADIWWKERVEAYLDQMPRIWNSFPEIFAGKRVPILAKVVCQAPGLPRALRLAISEQYNRDRNIKFRQIDLERDLSKLFVDLDVDIADLEAINRRILSIVRIRPRLKIESVQTTSTSPSRRKYFYSHAYDQSVSALRALLFEPPQRGGEKSTRTDLSKIILEGGPGQGKSTITQMATQVYRELLLERNDIDPENRWIPPEKVRLPFRLELGKFADWLTNHPDGSVEQYLAWSISQSSGGEEIGVSQLYDIVDSSPLFLVFDGLDEIGSDVLRDEVVQRINNCVYRFEEELNCDVKVIITTRPPAIAGRREQLSEFGRITIRPMGPPRIQEYLERWVSIQLRDDVERRRIRESFERRQNEPHVEALAKNPMQLSVLLHFIRLKGEAFPDRRAELYRDYFQIVIDRDVEKSPELRKHRKTIEGLHQLLGYKIHALTEAEQSDGTIQRARLLGMVEAWLRAKGHELETAPELFKIGEERLGLIVTLKGEGEEARYGFEIQPIREYFAAAFINEQMEGNAHNVFQKMVRRPFWREVALFLAGLRRPNEKADLVVRLKQLDNEDEFGWRQDGRSLTLQLMIEGALSDPQYVYSDALNYLLDLLDPRQVRVQNEPNDLLPILSILVRRGGVRQHGERLNRLLSDFAVVQDEAVVSRLFSVGSRALGHEIVRDAIMKHEGKSPSLIAKLRLLWPSSWHVDMTPEAKSHSFWEGVPDYLWAEAWIEAVLNDDAFTGIPAPARFHQLLVDHFAMMLRSPFGFIKQEGYSFSPKSNWAIWALLQLQQVLNLLSLDPDFSHTDNMEKILESIEGSPDFSTEGLSDSTRQIICDLIQISRNVVFGIHGKDTDWSKILAPNIQTLVNGIKLGGLNGWLTCRCVTTILRAIATGSQDDLDENYPTRSRFVFLLSQNQNWWPLIYEIETLNSGTKETKLHSDAIDPAIRRFARKSMSPSFYRFWSDRPEFIRSKSGEQLNSLTYLLEQNARNDGNEQLPWLSYIPLDTRIVRPLVDNCHDCLPDLLTALSRWNVVGIGTGKPLLTPRMNQVLKIARNSDDDTILRGCFIALSSSKFIRSAGKEILIKILKSDRRRGHIAGVLFPVRTSDRSERDPMEMEILADVAKSVLGNADDHAFRTVCTAASYQAEHSKIALPPLMDLEEELGITVGLRGSAANWTALR